MADPASSVSADDGSIKQTVTALARHITDMRRELEETLDLIGRLRASCVTLEAKLNAAEREHARLLGHVA